MKKFFAFMLMAALLLTMVPAAQAAGLGRLAEAQPACTIACGNCGKAFVDQDGDGLCDNRRVDCDRAFADENGDGICDNRSVNCDKAFADENGDGICDNRSRNHRPQASRRGPHHGQGHHGRG